MTWSAGMKSIVSRLRDKTGAAAIEFALILPCAALLLCAAFEFHALHAADRRIATAAATLADVVGRKERIAKGEIDYILIGASKIALTKSFPETLRVSAVVTDEKGERGTVVWSHSVSGPARAPESAVDVVGLTGGQIRCLNGMTIFAEITAAYQPVINLAIERNIWTFDKVAFACPRPVSGRVQIEN